MNGPLEFRQTADVQTTGSQRNTRSGGRGDRRTVGHAQVRDIGDDVSSRKQDQLAGTRGKQDRIRLGIEDDVLLQSLHGKIGGQIEERPGNGTRCRDQFRTHQRTHDLSRGTEFQVHCTVGA